MKLDFIKMHGCGNDYVYVDAFKNKISNPNKLSEIVSDRHFSIGGDGMIMVCPSDCADAKMRMFNADGSEGKMCGNGVRCVAKFVYDNGICKKNPLKIETLSGIKEIQLFIENASVVGASVNMGKAEFTPSLIPVKSDSDEPIINKTVVVGGKEHNITCVSMGNPHCVIFVPDDFPLWDFDIKSEGSPIETDPFFPEQVNVEFVHKVDDTHFEMRVWERGSGETFACGTGACATVAAACANKLCDYGTDITVKLRGGDLVINCTNDRIIMTGEAVTAFCGTVDIPEL